MNGSIPTGMGKPIERAIRQTVYRVYPHGYGETALFIMCPPQHTGLSPRVWGNQRATFSLTIAQRSIPTGMGKPDRRLLVFDSFRVYPHGYGETRARTCASIAVPGLSPRVWGNRLLNR